MFTQNSTRYCHSTKVNFKIPLSYFQQKHTLYAHGTHYRQNFQRDNRVTSRLEGCRTIRTVFVIGKELKSGNEMETPQMELH